MLFDLRQICLGQIVVEIVLAQVDDLLVVAVERTHLRRNLLGRLRLEVYREVIEARHRPLTMLRRLYITLVVRPLLRRVLHLANQAQRLILR